MLKMNSYVQRVFGMNWWSSEREKVITSKGNLTEEKQKK